MKCLRYHFCIRDEEMWEQRDHIFVYNHMSKKQIQGLFEIWIFVQKLEGQVRRKTRYNSEASSDDFGKKMIHRSSQGSHLRFCVFGHFLSVYNSCQKAAVPPSFRIPYLVFCLFVSYSSILTIGKQTVELTFGLHCNTMTKIPFLCQLKPGLNLRLRSVHRRKSFGMGWKLSCFKPGLWHAAINIYH